MKNMPNWVGWLITLAITLSSIIYAYATLNARVDYCEKTLDKVNIEVLQIQMEYNRKTLEKIEAKVDEIRELID